MDPARRRALAGAALEGYDHGEDAPLRATETALAAAASADRIVLVEGISDQIALEALAERQERDLSAEGTAIVPIGGAQAIRRSLLTFGPRGDDRPVFGLCDANEEPLFRRALAATGVGFATTDRGWRRSASSSA